MPSQIVLGTLGLSACHILYVVDEVPGNSRPNSLWWPQVPPLLFPMTLAPPFGRSRSRLQVA